MSKESISRTNDALIYGMLTSGNTSMSEALIRTHEKIHQISAHKDPNNTETDFIFNALNAFTDTIVGLYDGLTDAQGQILIEAFMEYINYSRANYKKAKKMGMFEDLDNEIDLFTQPPFNKDMI